MTKSRIYKFLFFIGLFFIGTGYIDAHNLNGIFTATMNEGKEVSDEGIKMGSNFDSTFSTAWDVYMNTWNTEILNPYVYDFNSFKQP